MDWLAWLSCGTSLLVLVAHVMQIFASWTGWLAHMRLDTSRSAQAAIPQCIA